MRHPAPPTTRALIDIVGATRTLEGGGFEVYRPLPSSDLDLLDPFLLLDEMAPRYAPAGESLGAPDHPHRGFETVTYIFQGEVEHRDSAGNHGLIGPGDVQWMTAGDGIVHSEMPSRRIQQDGGWGHGVQLWVNLPAALKRTTPRYQALGRGDIRTVRGDGWTAHVVAGQLFGVRGPAATHTPVGVARLTVEPGGSLSVDVESGHTAAVYAVSGSAALGVEHQRLGSQQLGVFDRSNGAVDLTVDAGAEDPLDAILLTGEPIGEPVARGGPFVMNHRAEIVEAIDDFHAGRMGTIPAVGHA